MVFYFFFYASFLGRCWPTIHIECEPFILRCEVMTFKKTYFEASKRYCHCIPAVGESVRKKWATPNLVHRRRDCISHLKKEQKGWRKLATGLKEAWLARTEKVYREQQLDLFNLQQAPLNSYTTEEINWIRKIFRKLCHSKYCKNSVLSAIKKEGTSQPPEPQVFQEITPYGKKTFLVSFYRPLEPQSIFSDNVVLNDSFLSSTSATEATEETVIASVIQFAF